MQLQSPDFNHNSIMPADLGDHNPALTIAGVPSGTKSLALIMHDPDAVSGDFTHWLLWNIDPETTAVEQNSVPNGAVLGVTDFGRAGYDGPQPPAGSGRHRYQFELFALDIVLDLTQDASRQELEKAMRPHIIEKTLLTGLVDAKA